MWLHLISGEAFRRDRIIDIRVSDVGTRCAMGFFGLRPLPKVEFNITSLSPPPITFSNVFTPYYLLSRLPKFPMQRPLCDRGRGGGGQAGAGGKDGCWVGAEAAYPLPLDGIPPSPRCWQIRADSRPELSHQKTLGRPCPEGSL